MLHNAKTEIPPTQLPFNTAVLVDVDKTLIIGQNGFNTALITALRNSGYTKIYLFTSMTMGDIVYEIADISLGKHDYPSRPKLIDELKAEGIEVIAVLTPADVTYNKDLGAAYKELFLEQHKRIGKELTEKNYSEDKEFQAASAEYSRCHKETVRIAEEEEKKPATEKSVLFKYLRAHLPIDTGISFIVIDDLDIHLNTIQQITSDAAVTCIQVNKNSNQKYFEESLSSHFNPLLLQLVKKEKPNEKVLLQYIDEFIRRGGTAAEEKNYDAACKCFEMAYLICDIARIPAEKVEYIIKKIIDAKARARSAGMTFFDNISIDILYKEVLNTNPVAMQFKKIELNIRLFKIKHTEKLIQKVSLFFESENKERDRDLNRTIIHPIACVLNMHPNQLDAGLALFNKVRTLIPTAQHQAGLATLRKSVIKELESKVKEQKEHGNIFKVLLIKDTDSNAFESFEAPKQMTRQLDSAVVQLQIHSTDSYDPRDNPSYNGSHLLIICADATNAEQELQNVKNKLPLLVRHDDKSIPKFLLLTNCNSIPISYNPHETKARLQFVTEFKETAKKAGTDFTRIGSNSVGEIEHTIKHTILPTIKRIIVNEEKPQAANAFRAF